MFITRPREKKNALAVPPRKKRKADFAIAEINFDDSARSDYLTGFHKRKVQRQKQAQEIAIEKARVEKIAFRKQLKEQRQIDVEEHVRQVNEALRQARLAGGEEVTDPEDEGNGDNSGDGDDDEWGGIKDPPAPEFVDHEEEYVDEDKYTTVTVEAVDVDREGMHALSGRHTSDSEDSGPGSDDDDEEGGGGEADGMKKKAKAAKTAKKNQKGSNADGQTEEGKDGKDQKKEWPKKKKKKFRYESKTERQLSKPKNSKRKR